MKKNLLTFLFLLVIAFNAVSQTYTTGIANWTNSWNQNGGGYDFTGGAAIYSFASATDDGETYARLITTDGTAGGTPTTLKPGQKLTITMGGQDGGGRTGINTGGRIGFALRTNSSLFYDGGTANVFNRYSVGALTRVEFVGGNSTATFINSGGASSANMPNFATFKAGVTYDVEVISDKEFNIVIGGTRNNVQLFANSGGSISQITATNVSANMDGYFTNLVVSNIPVNVTANTGETFTVTGVISNNGGTSNTLQKNGVGTVVLTGTNTYTGTTTVNAGTLKLNHTGGTTIPTTNNCTVSGGTLQISSDQTIANLDLSGGGSLTVDAGVTLTVTGTYTGGTGTITNNGTIIIQGNTSFPGSSATIGAMKNLTIDNATGVTLNKDISIANSGTLTVNSSKILVAGTQVISFGTSGNLVLNGTLKTANTNGFSGASNTTIANTNSPTITLGTSSTIEYNGSTQTLTSNTYKGLTINGGGTKTMNGDITINGVLTSTSGKVSIASNTLTLNGTVSGMSGSNSLVGSTSSKLTVSSTTSVGTVYFDQTTSADASTTTGTNALQNLVVSGSGGSVTLGNKLNLFERLSVSAGTLNTGDLLVLRSVSGSGSNNTAYVDQVGGTISGQVTVERYVHNQTQGWRALTAPVTYSGISQGYVSGNWQSNFGYIGNYGTRITGPSATNGIDDVTFSASLMTYNSTSGAWNKITNTTTETMAGANGSADNKGFFLFVRGDRTVTPNGYSPNAFVPTTLAAKGKLQTGTQTFSYGGAANKAWLVGNPYACPIDMSAVTFNGSIPNFIYVWDPNRPSSYSGVTGSYVTFDRSSNWASPSPSAGSTTKYFQSGQCFFVVPTSASGVSVVFNESNKNTSNQNNQTAGTGNGLSDEFNIKLSYIKTDGSKAEIDGIRAKFGTSYSTLIDADDAYKWSSADIENMSLLRNSASLVIEARPHIISSDSLFLNITNLSVGSNYEFKVNPVNFDASVSSCKLVDKFLNTETPISLNSTTLVSFNVSSVAGSNAAGRFYVVFNATGNLPTSNSLTVKAYKQNNSVKIDWEAIAENNIKTYTVEKSIDANSFNKLSEATAKNGNTNNAYSIVDNNPVIGVNYYRIQSTQSNNNKVYSTIVRVEMSDKGVKSITVYPNPVKSNSNTIGLQMNNLTAGNYTAVLYNVSGQQVWMNTMNHNGNNGSTNLQLNKTLASGTYQLQLTDTKGNSYKQSVLVVE